MSGQRSKTTADLSSSLCIEVFNHKKLEASNSSFKRCCGKQHLQEPARASSSIQIHPDIHKPFQIHQSHSRSALIQYLLTFVKETYQRQGVNLVLKARFQHFSSHSKEPPGQGLHKAQLRHWVRQMLYSCGSERLNPLAVQEASLECCVLCSCVHHS